MAKTFKNICDTLTIPSDCQERFLDLKCVAAHPFQNKQILMAGTSTFTAGYEVGRVNSFHHIVHYTLKGQGEFFNAKQTLKLNPGDVLLVSAGETYGYATSGKSWKSMWFHLKEHESWGTMREIGIQTRRSFLIQNMERAVEGYLSESPRESHASRRASHLFAELICHYLEQEVNVHEDTATKRYQEMLYGLWDKVNANLQYSWTVENLAAELHMSTVHFHRICNKYCTLPPMRMVTKLRMQRAQEMVINGYPLKIISEVVGYQNVFAFSVAFKRYAGYSPRDYKKIV